MMKCLGAVFFVLLSSSVWAGGEEAPKSPVFQTGEVHIRSQQNTHVFKTELATTPAQHEYGLMYRRYLAPDAAMLFVFPQNRQITFWMHNTYIPLDMLFISERGAVLEIVQNATPLSDTPIPSQSDKVRAVLEVAGGTVARLGLGVGDLVQTHF
jgi:uncharacterized protein